MWRFAFGGVSAEMQRRLDQPDKGHAWRGHRMEHAVAEAIQENLPSGVVTIFPQPSPERYPPDHVERCRHMRRSRRMGGSELTLR
jgi:LmbE family N-acetylglucosaminyl deacetylase